MGNEIYRFEKEMYRLTDIVTSACLSYKHSPSYKHCDETIRNYGWFLVSKFTNVKFILQIANSFTLKRKERFSSENRKTNRKQTCPMKLNFVLMKRFIIC